MDMPRRETLGEPAMPCVDLVPCVDLTLGPGGKRDVCSRCRVCGTVLVPERPTRVVSELFSGCQHWGEGLPFCHCPVPFLINRNGSYKHN